MGKKGHKIRQENLSSQNNNSVKIIGLSMLVLLVGFFSGWLIGSNRINKILSSYKLKPLRLDGYKFISPLLLCNLNFKTETPELKPMEEKIKNIIDNRISDKSIDNGSVYFRDLSTMEEINVNGDEKYFPASLNKIPLMIAFYKKAETNPSILQKKINVKNMPDFNVGQEIMPKDFVKNNGIYSVSELIDKMIKYSDNNSFNILVRNIDEESLDATYKDLNIYMPSDGSPIEDFVTAKDFSYFLRILYNATYLNKDLSERALELLSSSDFKNGLAQPISNDVPISHKYGLYTLKDGSSVHRELHDCGIIYQKNNPYILCVMTKSSSDIVKDEKTIQEVSKVVFDEVNKKNAK